MRIAKISIDRMKMLFGMIMLGSIWGLLECTVGALEMNVFGLTISSGAVMAGLFGIGFMLLARKLFDRMGISLGVAIFAGIMRIFAPVGSCQLCAAFAIMAEGLIFEFFVNRKVVMRSLFGTERDVRTLVFTGMIAGFTIFSAGYIITQFLTPFVVEGEIIAVSEVTRILPLIFGKAFFATVLGGASLPAVAALDLAKFDISSMNKMPFYAVSGLVSAACWVTMVVVVIF
ncbi:MAG: hypothetical protein U9R75_11095 [Candidatus Thermoplasmatota archaeon]|nr:hypothetical protein [Candidatus Thermoplasmatota archaeon]